MRLTEEIFGSLEILLLVKRALWRWVLLVWGTIVEILNGCGDGVDGWGDLLICWRTERSEMYSFAIISFHFNKKLTVGTIFILEKCNENVYYTLAYCTFNSFFWFCGSSFLLFRIINVSLGFMRILCGNIFQNFAKFAL